MRCKSIVLALFMVALLGTSSVTSEASAGGHYGKHGFHGHHGRYGRTLPYGNYGHHWVRPSHGGWIHSGYYYGTPYYHPYYGNGLYLNRGRSGVVIRW
jgi:hypothetical protein